MTSRTVGLDAADPESAIAAATERCCNWGRWGADDVIGTLNFPDDAERFRAARLVRRGVTFSFARSFYADGPQKSLSIRINPGHTMIGSGLKAERTTEGFLHGVSGVNVVFMPVLALTSGAGWTTSSTTARPRTVAGPEVSSQASETTAPGSKSSHP